MLTNKLESSKNQVVFLRDTKVILRPATMSDVPLLVRWLNDPAIRKFIAMQLPLHESAEVEIMKKMHERHPNNIHLMIDTAKGIPIGSIGLHDIDYRNGTATTGTLIGEKEYWSGGYGTSAKQLLLRYAFDTLNLRKVYSKVVIQCPQPGLCQEMRI